MENSFQIQEATVVPAKQATRISKPTFYCNEEEGIYRATVKALTEDGELLNTLEVHFTQEDYDKWGTDSEYIYNLIFTELGLTRL